MKSIFLIGFILLATCAHAEQIRTVFNPFTSRLDYITALTTTSIQAGNNITVSTTSAGVIIEAAGSSGVMPGSTNYIQNTLSPSTTSQMASLQNLQVFSDSFMPGTTFYQNGDILFGSGTSAWDNANMRLGIGTPTPGYPLHISFDNQVQIPRIELTQANAGAIGRSGTINIHDNLIGTDSSFSAGWENHGSGASSHMNLFQNGMAFWDLDISQSSICMGLGCAEGIGQSITLNNSITNVQSRTRVIVSGGSNQLNGDLFIIAQDGGGSFLEGTHVFTVDGNGKTIIGAPSISDPNPGTVSIVGASTEKWSLYVSSSNASFHIAVSTSTGHFVTNGPIPTMGTCGTSPSVIGDDGQGTITVGSGVVTACTLNFANSWTATPVCLETNNSTTVAGDISAVSATAVTFSFSATLGGGQIYYHCGCSGPSCT